MSRQVLEVEALLQAITAEQVKMLKHVEVQQAAMKAFDLAGMDAASKTQEAARLRIVTLENKRRSAVAGLAKLHGFTGTMRVEDIAQLYPARAQPLRKLRDELRDVMIQLAARTHVAGRIAGAVLGHLNTVVRIVAGAVEKAGIYTKHGVPQVSARIRMMEAVG